MGGISVRHLTDRWQVEDLRARQKVGHKRKDKGKNITDLPCSLHSSTVTNEFVDLA
jgi:hypothetical protein